MSVIPCVARPGGKQSGWCTHSKGASEGGGGKGEGEVGMVHHINPYNDVSVNVIKYGCCCINNYPPTHNTGHLNISL